MKNILLIEDNEDHAELILRALEKARKTFHVEQVPGIKKAVHILKNKNFDLILSDYYLPDSKGESHIRQLAKIAPETPIIIITGQGDEKTAARSIKAGADDYIVKTREALLALPRILNRSLTKHQTHLKRKQLALDDQMQHQKTAIDLVVSEVEKIEEKIKKLNIFQLYTSGSENNFVSLEGLNDQIKGLKKFLKKIFHSNK